MLDLPPAGVALVFWIVAATGVAFLPMRLQFAPGLALLLAVPALLCWIAVSVGAWLALFGLVAFLSMFRRPLIHLWRKARGAA